jgi:hypothetical protein
LNELKKGLDNRMKNKAVYRLGLGMRCFIVDIDNMLAGISWVSFNRSKNEGV